MYTEQMSQALGIPGAEIDPQSGAVGTLNTGGVDMQKFRRAMFIAFVGSVGAAGTVTPKLQESTDNATFTDLAGAAGNTVSVSNQVVTLECRAGQLTKRYVRMLLTIAGNAVQVAGIGLGGEAQHKPGSLAGPDIAAVAQRFVL